MTNTAPAPLSAEQLTRYDYVPGEAGRMIIDQDDNGAYVLRSDVLALIAQARAAKPVQADTLLTDKELADHEYMRIYVGTLREMVAEARAAQAHHAAAKAPAAQAVDANKIRDQITADANCILRLLDTVDKLVGSTSGATESIQEHAQHIVQYAAKIAASPATVTAPAQATKETVITLLNHIEDVVDDVNWEKIDTKLWNAVTSAYASPATVTAPAAQQAAPKSEDA